MNMDYVCRWLKADGTPIFSLSLIGLNALRGRLNLPEVRIEEFLPSKRMSFIYETARLCTPALMKEVIGDESFWPEIG